VALASVMPGGRRGRVLALAGVARIVPEGAWFSDADTALEHAESHLLKRRWPEHANAEELAVEQMDVCAGMSAGEISALQDYLRRETHGPGVALFGEGTPGDRMYLIAKGAVTVKVRLFRKRDRTRRLATYSPGVIVGEMAVLEDKARSADAVCDGDTVLQVLEREALERMAREQPALYGRFLFNLSRQVASRLRATTLELRSALD
jgi:CRP-like cAMP-binding protein